MDVLDNLGNVLQCSQLSECAGFLSGSLTLPHGLVQYQLRGQDIGGTPFTHIVPDSYITFNTPQLPSKTERYTFCYPKSWRNLIDSYWNIKP